MSSKSRSKSPYDEARYVRPGRASEEEKEVKISKAEEELFNILNSGSPLRGGGSTGEAPRVSEIALHESSQRPIEPIQEAEREETTF